MGILMFNSEAWIAGLFQCSIFWPSQYSESQVDPGAHSLGGLGDAMLPLVLKVAVHQEVGTTCELDGEFVCVVLGLADIEFSRLTKADGGYDAVTARNSIIVAVPCDGIVAIPVIVDRGDPAIFFGAGWADSG
jgi:hypothetical protein